MEEPTLYTYVRKHHDGDWMLMVANHRQCHCLVKSPREDKVERTYEHVEKQKAKYGALETILYYYKLAKKQNIYATIAY